MNQKDKLRNPETIVLYLRRTRLILIAAGSLIFVSIGLVFLAHSYEFPELTIIIVSCLSIGFFGLGFVYALYRLVVRKPALMLSREGIFDNASGLSAGLMPWQEIDRIYCTSFLNQEFVSITTKDQEGFLQRMNAVKAGLMRWSISLVGAPVNLPVNALGMKSVELRDLIQSFRELRGL